MKPRIVILGAGITGLTTAWKLLSSTQDFQVVLIERDSVPGGLAKTLVWNGFNLDLGPHRIYTEIPEIRQFLRRFCEHQSVPIQRSSRMYLNGQYIPYPIQPLTTLKALGLSQAVQFLLSALGTLFNPSKIPALSYEEYVCRYYGKALYHAVFAPLAEKVWGLPPSQISAETARVRLRGETIWHALKDSLFLQEQTYVSEFPYPLGGIGDISKQFAQEITTNSGFLGYGHTITRIYHRENRITEIETVRDNETYIFPCDIVVSTIPLPDFIALLSPSPDSKILDAAARLHFRSLVLLYLLFPTDFGIADTWLYFPDHTIPFSRIYVPNNFMPKENRPTQTCLCLEFTCEAGDTIWNASPSELSQQAEPILLKSGLIGERSADALAVRIREGYPVYRVGYDSDLQTVLSQVRSLRNSLTAGRQGLFRHNNIDQAMQMGLLAAELLLEKPACLDEWYDNLSRFNDYRIID